MSTTPVFFIDKSGRKSVGYDARILPNVADVYLKYRDKLNREGKTAPARYERIIVACELDPPQPPPLYFRMIVITVQGPSPERERLAVLVETTVQGSRYTLTRFPLGVTPPDSAVRPDVRLLERE